MDVFHPTTQSKLTTQSNLAHNQNSPTSLTIHTSISHSNSTHTPISPSSSPSHHHLTYPTLTQLTHYTPLYLFSSIYPIYSLPITIYIASLHAYNHPFCIYHHLSPFPITLHNRSYHISHPPLYRIYIHLTPINSNQHHNPYHSTNHTNYHISLVSSS